MADAEGLSKGKRKKKTLFGEGKSAMFVYTEKKTLPRNNDNRELLSKLHDCKCTNTGV